MKKHLRYLGAAMCAVAISYAQPVLTATGINALPGEKYLIKDGSAADAGNSGANQNWDVSAIAVTGTRNLTVSAASNPVFPDATLQMDDGNNVLLIKTSSGIWQNVGFITSVGDMPFTDAEDFLKFPMSYNNTFTDTWTLNYTIGADNFVRTGTTTVTYDGYGTIKSPAGTFSNVARTHYYQVYTESSAMGTVNYINDQYYWWRDGFHYPVASVFTITMDGSKAAFGFYTDNVSPVTDFVGAPESEFTVFPNPVSGQLFVGSGTNQEIKVLIHDLQGKLVDSMIFEAGARAALNTSCYRNGLYHVRVISGYKSRTIKVMVNH